MEDFGSFGGGFWGFFGTFWGHLGRLIAQDAPKNSQRRSQELPTTAPRGPTRPQKAAKMVPRDFQEGPRGHHNQPQTIPKTKTQKTVKMMTLSMKIKDLGVPKPIKLTPN